MPGWAIGIGAGVFLAIDLWVVFALVLPRVVRSSWGRLQQAFPARDAAPGAVRREFESFQVGGLGMGSSVHVEVDDEHLHLRPAYFGRLIGCGAMSIPWERVEPRERHGRSRRSVEIEGVRVLGPAWCLDLAQGGDGAGSAS